MNIQLGNLELKDIVKEEYLEKISTFLNENGFQREQRCDDIEKKLGNYHIFDLPRLITVCDEEKMQQFIKFLKTENIVEKGFNGLIGMNYTELK